MNHPNIALIYGVERSDRQLALVMELVEGETLADRIARGPLPLEAWRRQASGHLGVRSLYPGA